MTTCPLIALTGGPGGGKSTLIEALLHDPAWEGRLAALPEAIFTLRHAGVSSRQPLFQRLMVCMQIALEDGLQRALMDEAPRLILCHRGSLDPLAYWLAHGWPEQEFFRCTGMSRPEHYQRYAAVIHLVTAADGALPAYRRWPEAHRPETPEQAIRLDGLLQDAWQGHPQYYRIDNQGKAWDAKMAEACAALRGFLPPAH